VFRYDGELITMAAHHNLDDAALEAVHRIWPMRPDNRTVMGRTILKRDVVHVPDVESEPSLTFAAAHRAALGIRTYLGVPMLRDGNPIGAIALYRREVALFSERQIELVKAFADQAVIAIENTRLLDELRESLQQQTATADVLKVISSSTGELQPVFQAMLENAVRICGAKFGNLWLREGNAFRIGATHGAPPAFVEFLHSEQVFTSMNLAKLASTKEAFQLADIAALPTHGDKLRQVTINLAGARTLIGVPMLQDNEVIGAIGHLSPGSASVHR
jgi:GAF domain-containing protein